MKFLVTLKETVINTFKYEIEIPDEEGLTYLVARNKAISQCVPDNVTGSGKLVKSETDAICLHNNQYVDDRYLFVCKDCQETLGR